MTSQRLQHRWASKTPAIEFGSGRRAMTLVEVLLVLVLLVVVGSLAAPLFEGSFSTIRLRRASDHVLAAWSQARTHAIEAGNTYQFRFEPNGGLYRVEPWNGGLETDQADEAAVDVETGTSSLESELTNWTLEEKLPEQTTFCSAESVGTNALGQQEVTRLDQQLVDNWSAPILFFPDGTTSSASLLLQNNKEIFQRVTLRSLTGVGRSSELMGREAVDRLTNR